MRPSCYSCIRVNTLKSTSDDVIKKLLAVLQEKGWQSDPAEGRAVFGSGFGGFGYSKFSAEGTNSHISNDIANELVDSDWLPDDSVKNCFISKCKIPGLDYVVFVKGSGPHTIDYEYKEDNYKPPKEVIVSRKCAEAVLRGAQVYVPGVLTCSAHVEKEEQVAVSVSVEQPEADGGWVVGLTRGTVLQASHTDPYYFERNGLYIGQGTAMMSRSGIFRVLKGVAINMDNRVFKFPSFHDLLEEEIFLQNLPSIIPAHALDPQEGEKILDMCAAPGGKTTAMAILMKDKGEVIAADRSHNKCVTTCKLDALKSVRKIDESDSQDAPKCGESVSIQTSDSSKLDIENISDAVPGCANATLDPLKNGSYTSKAELRKNIRRMENGPGRSNTIGERVERSKGFLPNSFDRVLLDAPCSALDLRPRLFAGEDTVESLRTHAKYQRRMLDQAVQLIRPGGVLVYSTCTINPGENEALVRYALDTYNFLSLASQHPKVGGPGLVGSCQFSDGYQE
ncbi:hypothetical protein ACS0TY_030731 [Phlomoides rotata]